MGGKAVPLEPGRYGVGVRDWNGVGVCSIEVGAAVSLGEMDVLVAVGLGEMEVLVTVGLGEGTAQPASVQVRRARQSAFLNILRQDLAI